MKNSLHQSVQQTLVGPHRYVDVMLVMDKGFAIVRTVLAGFLSEFKGLICLIMTLMSLRIVLGVNTLSSWTGFVRPYLHTFSTSITEAGGSRAALVQRRTIDLQDTSYLLTKMVGP